MPVLKLPKGIYCPACKGTDVTPTGHYRPLSGLRIRYFGCNNPACGSRFKTQERLGGLLKRPSASDDRKPS